MNAEAGKVCKIVGGPSLDRILDVFKYSMDDEKPEISAFFQIESNKGFSFNAQNTKFSSIRLGNDSNSTLILEGRITVEDPGYNGRSWTDHKFKMCYDHKKRAGTVNFLD